MEDRIRHAAWVARCVGRAEAIPLSPDDLGKLASDIRPRDFEADTTLFEANRLPPGVCIIQQGVVALRYGTGRDAVIINLLRPGNVDGDTHLILDRAPPYSARTMEDVRCLFIARNDFERLLAGRPQIARRWTSNVAGRLASSQERLIQLLGHSLTQKTSRLLMDEAFDNVISLPQRTISAMLAARRSSVNRILRELEQRGLIEIDYAHIKILDREMLARLATAKAG